MNTAIDKLKRIINNRVVGLIARGGSLEELEKRIEEYKDLDICWASLNLFTPAEDFILKKINKTLSIVSDCTNLSNRDYFEPNVRRPRLERFLARQEDNLLQISNTVIADLEYTKQHDILTTYKDKIITIDQVFTGEGYSQDLWKAPPNSITLLLASLIAGHAKKIIMFGYDGFNGDNNLAINTYYKEYLERDERVKATGRFQVGSLVTDSRDFNRRWNDIYELYKQTYKSNTEVVNCSPSTMFTCIRRIDYDNIKNEL